jgi:uncharacterized membrane-anchored protein
MILVIELLVSISIILTVGNWLYLAYYIIYRRYLGDGDGKKKIITLLVLNILSNMIWAIIYIINPAILNTQII